jgi:hypothetical protein
VVNIEDSQSEPCSPEMSSILWFTYKLDGINGPLDGRKPKIIKRTERGKSHQKIFKKPSVTSGKI